MKYQDDDLIRHVGDIPTRTARALAKVGIQTVGELSKSIEVEELNVPGVGSVGWYDIYMMLGKEWIWKVPAGREK